MNCVFVTGKGALTLAVYDTLEWAMKRTTGSTDDWSSNDAGDRWQNGFHGIQKLVVHEGSG